MDRRDFIIGRGLEADVRVDDPIASPRHALLTVFEDRKVMLLDLGSPNGTFVADSLFAKGFKRITTPKLLHMGSIIRIGRSEITVLNLLCLIAGRWSLVNR